MLKIINKSGPPYTHLFLFVSPSVHQLLKQYIQTRRNFHSNAKRIVSFKPWTLYSLAGPEHKADWQLPFGDRGWKGQAQSTGSQVIRR